MGASKDTSVRAGSVSASIYCTKSATESSNAAVRLAPGKSFFNSSTPSASLSLATCSPAAALSASHLIPHAKIQEVDSDEVEEPVRVTMQ
jgi:hypothetical protein